MKHHEPTEIDALLGSGGAAVLAAIWKYWTQYAQLITAGAVGFVLVFVVYVAYRMLRQQKLDSASLIDVESVEATVRRWADELAWGIQRIDDANAFFALKLTLPTGGPTSFVVASRMRSFQKYLSVAIGVTLTVDDQKVLHGFSGIEVNAFASSLRLEMARAMIEYRNIEMPLKDAINLQWSLPIATLTQESFLTAVLSVIMAKNLLSELIISRLRAADR